MNGVTRQWAPTSSSLYTINQTVNTRTKSSHQIPSFKTREYPGITARLEEAGQTQVKEKNSKHKPEGNREGTGGGRRPVPSLLSHLGLAPRVLSWAVANAYWPRGFNCVSLGAHSCPAPPQLPSTSFSVQTVHITAHHRTLYPPCPPQSSKAPAPD